MTRVLSLVTLILALLAAPLAVEAQPSGKVPRIGYLCTHPCGGPRHQAFVQSLEALGHVDGRTMTLVYPRDTFTEVNDLGRLPEMAAELIQRKVDVTFAVGDVLAARAAQQASSRIPIVMAVAGDPVKLGLVRSLARPGGNVTGITYIEDQLAPKQFELLKEVVPALSRVGALVDASDPASSQWVAHLDTAARSLGLRLDAVQVRAPTNFEDAFATIKRGRAGALIVVSSPNHFTQRSRIAALAIQHRLVAVASYREFAEARGLLSYGPQPRELFQRAAYFIDRILKGARPSDLPVEQPTRLGLVVNLLAAKDLGLTIPPSVLARADEVIQ